MAKPQKAAPAAGAALAAATAVRPASAIALVAFAVYLLAVRRRSVLPFLGGALPLLLLLGAYNWLYLGAPWQFGQAQVDAQVVIGKTGRSDLFQTPLAVGAAGLLASPSRGLFFLIGWNDLSRYELVLPARDEVTVVFTEAEAERLIGEGATFVRREHFDIDRPENQHRLWSFRENQFFYYLDHYSQSRTARKTYIEDWLENPSR